MINYFSDLLGDKCSPLSPRRQHLKVTKMKQNASTSPTPMLHDLAESTQALGNYLSALQHSLSDDIHSPATPEIVDRALLQYARVVEAMQALGTNAQITSL
jgi:hypothetical protein